MNEQLLRKLFSAGLEISNGDYCQHPRLHHTKTFYLFCKRLLQDSPEPVSSTILNRYILSHVRAKNNRMNPQGWFGKAWTRWIQPSTREKLFRGEYLAVLTRSGADPYQYAINPEFVHLVKRVVDSLATEAPQPQSRARLAAPIRTIGAVE
jgi:hypothetical protein